MFRAVGAPHWSFDRSDWIGRARAIIRRLPRVGRRAESVGRRLARILWIGFLELLCPVIAALLAPLFYWRLLQTNPLDAATLPPGDITELHYPYRRWVAEQLARGIQPWWNEFIGAGHSAIGDIQFHTLYPPDAWLAGQTGGAFPFPSFELGVVGHVAIGAVLAYFFVRRLTASRCGGLVGALVFGFGGYLAGFPVQQMILLETSVWLPGILLLIDLGADYNLVTAFVAGAGGLALAALAGHPQTLFYVGFASLVYLLFKAWHGGRIRLAALLGLPVLFGGGAALAAEALLPAYFHLSLTDRTEVGFAFSSTGFDLREVLGLVFPVEMGGAALYNGVFTLILIGVGLASRHRRSDKLFWVAFGSLGLLFSFGSNTFFQSLEYLALASFKFRDAERLAFFVGTSAAVLAGFGAAELTRPHRLSLRRLGGLLRWPIIAVAALLGLIVVFDATAQGGAQGNLQALADRAGYTLVILALGCGIVAARARGVVAPGVAGVLAILLVGGDLFTTNWQGNLRPGDPTKVLTASPIVEYLQSYTSGLFRISSEGLLPGDGNTGDLFRLEDIVVNSPLETTAYSQFDQQVPELVRWQVLNVRYVITQRKFTDQRFQLLRQDGPANLYQLDLSLQLPRAYAVHQVVAAPDHAAALAFLKDANLRQVAVVENAGGLPAGLDARDDPRAFGSPPDPAPGGVFTSTVRVLSDQGNEASITATLSQPGLVILSDLDYPGWQATVDGRPVPVYLTNGVVRSVYVGAGSHVIAFTFTPPGVALGAAISQQAPTLLADVVFAEVGLRLLWLVLGFGWRMAWRGWRGWRARRKLVTVSASD